MEVIITIRSFTSVRQKTLFFCLCYLVGFLLSSQRPVYQEALAEYQVKAVFLYNFSRFVQWPQQSLPYEDSSFVIGILGDDPFGPYLERTIRGESVSSRPMVVKRFDDLEEASQSHILFISKRYRNDLRQVLDKLDGKNILTVSDIRGFGKLGGIIEFQEIENKISFKINQESAIKSQLHISPKLLKLAEIVSTEMPDQR